MLQQSYYEDSINVIKIFTILISFQEASIWGRPMPLFRRELDSTTQIPCSGELPWTPKEPWERQSSAPNGLCLPSVSWVAEWWTDFSKKEKFIWWKLVQVYYFNKITKIYHQTITVFKWNIIHQSAIKISEKYLFQSHLLLNHKIVMKLHHCQNLFSAKFFWS